MSGLLELVGGNALSAAILFAGALVVQRFVSRPSIRHAAWLAVILRLLVPPILSVPVRGPAPPPPSFSVERLLEPPGEIPPVSAPRVSGPRGLGKEPSTPPVRADLPSTTPVRRALAHLELGGVAVLGLLAVVRWVRFRRRLRHARPAPPELSARVARLAKRLGVRHMPRVLLTDERISPLLIGLRSATIVLPRPLLARLTRDETTALLAHELAHVRRGDPWIRPVEVVATALYWWFPLLHAARRRLRRAEEVACDALVVRAFPRLRRAYADGLLETVEFVSHSPASPILATGATDSRDLKERIVNILHSKAARPLPRPARPLALLAGLVAVSLTPGWTRVSPDADEPVAPEAPAEERGAAPSDAEGDERSPNGKARAQIAFRRAQLELQRQLVELHRQQEEMERSVTQLQESQYLEQLEAHMAALSRTGLANEERAARAAYEEALLQTRIQGEIRAREEAHREKAEQLQLRMAELELSRDESRLKGDERAMREAALAVEKLGEELRALDLEQMKVALERAEAELALQRAQYERLARELDDPGKAEE